MMVVRPIEAGDFPMEPKRSLAELPRMPVVAVVLGAALEDGALGELSGLASSPDVGTGSGAVEVARSETMAVAPLEVPKMRSERAVAAEAAD